MRVQSCSVSVYIGPMKISSSSFSFAPFTNNHGDCSDANFRGVRSLGGSRFMGLSVTISFSLIFYMSTYATSYTHTQCATGSSLVGFFVRRESLYMGIIR